MKASRGNFYTELEQRQMKRELSGFQQLLSACARELHLKPEAN